MSYSAPPRGLTQEQGSVSSQTYKIQHVNFMNKFTFTLGDGVNQHVYILKLYILQKCNRKLVI